MHAPLDRRHALAALSAAGLGLVAADALGQPAIPDPRPAPRPAQPSLFTPQALGWDAAKGEFALPPLPYPKNALEPHIDAQTMEIHHTKHHAAYVAGLNKALAELARLREGQTDPALVKHWSRELSFHAGGHVNHCLFWLLMAPPGKGGGGQPSGDLAAAIDRDFGSFEKCVAHFKAAAGAVEGGGWAWLVRDLASDRLWITQTEKQQDMFPPGARPVLGVDVWEHAYYLKYQNRRGDYVNAWLNVVNWKAAESLYALVRG